MNETLKAGVNAYCRGPKTDINGEKEYVHLHADGKWWVFNDDRTAERGPFDSEELANEALIQDCVNTLEETDGEQ